MGSPGNYAGVSLIVKKKMYVGDHGFPFDIQPV